jgi:4-hydroxyphenylpyruvate dioxygenase
MSLGRACAHDLHVKLDQARRYGFEGIELFYEDLEYLAKTLSGGPTPANLIAAAKVVKQLCDDRRLEIINLQPFMHYEGLRDRERHRERIEEMKLWIKLAKLLDTDLILIPSSFLSKHEITGDINTIVADLREVAELGLQENPPMRFAYESLAWGTYANTWEQCWDVVNLVQMPNFGMVIDTFNLAGRVYADPSSPSAKTPDADAAIKASLSRLLRTVDVRKIFFVQIVDGKRLKEPIEMKPDQPSRMTWSRSHRLFYGEQDLGGYLPVKEIMSVVLKELGYDGYVSAELFSSDLWNPEPNVPENMARRAAVSWRKLSKDLKLVSTHIETRL